MRIDKKIHGYANYLTKADLAPNRFPTLKEIWKKSGASKLSNDAKRENRSGRRGRSGYFCVGFSKIWREKIYNIIKNFVTPTALPGYLPECSIIDYLT